MAINIERDKSNSQEQKDDQNFFIEKKEDGVFVRQIETGQVYFKTRSGSWFWTMGPGNPFGEDVELGRSSFLDSLLDETLNPNSTKELPDSN